MNAQELFLGDGRSAGVWYCGDCRIVARAQDDAQRCCAPRLCECGVELTGSDKHYTRCSACRYAEQERRDLAQFNAATGGQVLAYQDSTDLRHGPPGQEGPDETWGGHTLDRLRS